MEEAILLEFLPQNFEHRVVTFQQLESGGEAVPVPWTALVRAKLHSQQDAQTWLRDFEEATETKWIVAKTFPAIGTGSCPRLIFRKCFECHHSNLHKSPTAAVNRNRFRGLGCEAKLEIKIKVETPKSRRNDPLVKEGFPAIILIHFVHSHPIGTETALSYLPMKPEVRDIFLQYFDDGCGPAEAMRLFEEKWGRSAGKNSKSIYTLYQKWKKEHPELAKVKGRKPRRGKKAKNVKKSRVEEILEVTSEEVEVVDPVALDSPHMDLDTGSSLLEECWHLFSEKLQNLAFNEDALFLFKRSLEEVVTPNEMTDWLLHSAGLELD